MSAISFRHGIFFAAIGISLLAACQPTQPPAKTSEQVVAPLARHDWSLPATSPAAQADLIETSDGRLLLSWVESRDAGHALQLSIFDGKAWSAPRTVAQGDDWFVNWADTPHVAVSGNIWWAHWLRKSGGSGHAYDVVLSRSADQGATWSTPVPVNTDGKPGEHGFVSMWPEADGALGIAWLDGRNAGNEGHGGHAEHAGAMTLRTAIFAADGERHSESELDARTCDCCQTAMAQTSRGPLLAWRDRDENEIRDIVVARRDGDAWTPAHKIHDDGWKIPGCPVNGPAAAARETQAWVAWYTAAGDVPSVRIAYSRDAGDTFSAPRDVDSGDAVQGRVAVAASDDTAWIAWLREDAQGQSLWLAAYDADLSRERQRIRVADLQGRGRATGFPQLQASGDAAYLVWTDIVDGKPELHGARIAEK